MNGACLKGGIGCAAPPREVSARDAPGRVALGRRRAGLGRIGVARAGMVGIALVAAWVLSGCGFHLQGRTPLPDVFKTPYLQTVDRQSEFVISLRKALLVSGAHLVPSKDKASVVVNIMKDEVVRRTLSVSVQNQPDEYEVTYNVRFSVTAGDKELLPPTDITNVRSYAFAEQLLLAKDREEMILRQDMAHDLADMVMRRFARL
jgi:LPS-assembly lipoprotein